MLSGVLLQLKCSVDGAGGLRVIFKGQSSLEFLNLKENFLSWSMDESLTNRKHLNTQ